MHNHAYWHSILYSFSIQRWTKKNSIANEIFVSLMRFFCHTLVIFRYLFFLFFPTCITVCDTHLLPMRRNSSHFLFYFDKMCKSLFFISELSVSIHQNVMHSTQWTWELSLTCLNFRSLNIFFFFISPFWHCNCNGFFSVKITEV